jgi:hypothetical protein
MTNGKRSAGILVEAERASANVLNGIPIARTVHRVNTERVIVLCRELVTARPIQEPLAPRVAEIGKIRYPKFPAAQSLLNRYSLILRIWRKAFYDIASVTAVKPRASGELPMMVEAAVAGLDSGGRANVELLIVYLKEVLRENNRLKEISKQSNLPRGASGKGTSGHPVPLDPLVRWLKKLDGRNSYLVVDDLGVRISRNARANSLIMEAEVLNTLLELAGHLVSLR